MMELFTPTSKDSELEFPELIWGISLHLIILSVPQSECFGYRMF